MNRRDVISYLDSES